MRDVFFGPPGLLPRRVYLLLRNFGFGQLGFPKNAFLKLTLHLVIVVLDILCLYCDLVIFVDRVALEFSLDFKFDGFN